MIAFTPDLITNVSLIDEQHKELFNRINAVSTMGTRSTGKDETEKTLDLLNAYVVKHFGDEEALQRKCGYPKYDMHRAQHQIYINECKRMKSEYMKNGPSVQFTLQLSKSIIDWIIKHIKNVDKELGVYINQNK
jgi:hemerythrin